MIMANQYNASGRAKRTVKPKHLISLDIDFKNKGHVLDMDLVNKALAAWN